MSMSVDLADPKIISSYDAVLQFKADWLVLRYGNARERGGKDKLTLLNVGDGDTDDLREFLRREPDEVYFGFCREMGLEGSTSGGREDYYVLILYVPKHVSGVRRARALVHSRVVGSLLKEHHATLTVCNLEDLNTAAVREQLQISSPAPAVRQVNVHVPSRVQRSASEPVDQSVFHPHHHQEHSYHPPHSDLHPKSNGDGFFKRMYKVSSDNMPHIPFRTKIPVPVGAVVPKRVVSQPQPQSQQWHEHENGPVYRTNGGGLGLEFEDEDPPPTPPKDSDFVAQSLGQRHTSRSRSHSRGQSSGFLYEPGRRWSEETDEARGHVQSHAAPYQHHLPGSPFTLPSSPSPPRLAYLLDQDGDAALAVQKQGRDLPLPPLPPPPEALNPVERIRQRAAEVKRLREEHERKAIHEEKMREAQLKREKEQELRIDAEKEKRLLMSSEKEKRLALAERARIEAERKAEEEEREQELARKREAERLRRTQESKRHEEERLEEQRRIEESTRRMEEQRSMAEYQKRQKIKEIQSKFRATDVTDPVLLSGTVTVQSPESAFWKRRFFELNGTTLLLFKSSKERVQPLDVVELARGRVRTIREPDDGVELLEAIPFSFAIDFVDDGQWLLFSDTAEDKDVLISLLSQAAGL